MSPRSYTGSGRIDTVAKNRRSHLGITPPPPPDTAYIVVNGRRWRAADPSIPASFRQELVNELMSARRGVRDAKNETELRRSRQRVNDAKIALGERGHAWWLPPTAAATRRRIEAATRALLRSRQPGRSICPSDVARTVGGATWRALMVTVRECAVTMSERGEIEILRGGRVVTADPTTGVLRYRLARRRTTPAPRRKRPGSE